MHKTNNVYSKNELLEFSSISLIDNSVVTSPELSIKYHQIEELEEQYSVNIYKDYRILITYGNERSKKYALKTIKNKLQSNTLYCGLIEDGPKFKMRGIIEGFYGTPWNHEERLDMLNFLEQEDMNTYIYAPKDDDYHRSKWREAYPKVELNKLLELVNESQSKNIDFYFAISPGKDFNYSLESDFISLFKKVDSMLSYGVTHFSLLLDDINYKLEGKDLIKFSTPGLAHAYICNRLYEHLFLKNEECKLIMCPTEYWQNFDTPYRQDLKKELNINILVFWTGYHTIAEFIPNIDGENVKKYFGHDLVLWENYPTNDMQPYLLYLGPLTNRGNSLDQSHKGMVINPMVQWSLSKLPLLTASEYMWNPSTYNAEEVYNNALEKICTDSNILPHLKNILDNFLPSIIYLYKDERLENAIKNEQIEVLRDYYQELEEDINIVLDMENIAFINQLSPWLDRILYDKDIIEYIYNKEYSRAKELLDKHLDKSHAINTNYAVRYAKKIKIYDGLLFKKSRTSYW